MSNKKVLFIINRLGGGGAERVAQLLASSIDNSDYSVKVLCVSKFEREYDHGSLNVEYLNSDGVPLSKFQRIKAIRKYLKKDKPDVVIAFEYFINMDVIIATRGLKLKVIVSERNDPAQQKDRKLVNFLRDYLYRKADALVCQTPDAKAYFSEKVQRHAVIIPNPVKSGLPQWSGEDSKKIINFCRLEKQKNLPLLINAFERIYAADNGLELYIYGDGKEKESLQKFIDSKGLEKAVHLCAAVNNIHEIAAGCRLFVSSSDYEGLSNSMLEAMAMGMPVICTDCPCGGARMVIENGVNGILVPVGDETALVNAMQSVLSDKIFAKKIADKAKQISEELSQTKIAEKWYELL